MLQQRQFQRVDVLILNNNNNNIIIIIIQDPQRPP